MYIRLYISHQILSVQGPVQTGQSKRNLSIHEHMSWDLLEKAGVKLPRHKTTESVNEVAKIAQDIGE